MLVTKPLGGQGGLSPMSAIFYDKPYPVTVNNPGGPFQFSQDPVLIQDQLWSWKPDFPGLLDFDPAGTGSVLVRNYPDDAQYDSVFLVISLETTLLGPAGGGAACYLKFHFRGAGKPDQNVGYAPFSGLYGLSTWQGVLDFGLGAGNGIWEITPQISTAGSVQTEHSYIAVTAGPL